MHNLCIASDITDKHQSTSQISFLFFYFTKDTPIAEASRLCHHLIYPTVPRSEARTCRLLIVAEGNTSNPTPKMLTKLMPILLPTHNFFQKPARLLPTWSSPHLHLLLLPSNPCLCPFLPPPPKMLCISTYLSSFQALLASSWSLLRPCILHTDHFPPSSHQWGATNPHPSRRQTPMHPMQTKSLLKLMRPRSAVTNHQGRPNSSHVHTNRPAREFSAWSPIVRLHYDIVIMLKD